MSRPDLFIGMKMADKKTILSKGFVERFEGDSTVTDSQCVSCSHWLGHSTCEAYPQGIPMNILVNRVSHKESQPGDQGIMWSAKAK
jgi:hypothetical protein